MDEYDKIKRQTKVTHTIRESFKILPEEEIDKLIKSLRIVCQIHKEAGIEALALTRDAKGTARAIFILCIVRHLRISDPLILVDDTKLIAWAYEWGQTLEKSIDQMTEQFTDALNKSAAEHAN